MKNSQKFSTTITIIFSAMVGINNTSAEAFMITQNNNHLDLLSSLLGDNTGLSNFEVELRGDGRAFGIFQDDPFNLDSGIVLSTGRVVDLVGTNTEDGDFSSTGRDLSQDFLDDGDVDDISLQISFDSDGTKDSLFFQYVFGSEEFVEYGGSQFNDQLSIKLNGFEWARLSDGQLVTINNLVPSPIGGYHPDFIYNPVVEGPTSNQTRLDGYTIPLLFENKFPLSLKNGKNTLVINIKDEEDGIFDSAVFIKGGTFGTVEPSPIIIDEDNGGDGSSGNGDSGNDNNSNDQPSSVSTPEPNYSLGILAFGILGLTCIIHQLPKP